MPPLTGENGERYTDHNPMLTAFRYTVNGTDPAPEALETPVAVPAATLALREALWTFVRLVQVVCGLVELPYLIGQGVDLLINGKMP